MKKQFYTLAALLMMSLAAKAQIGIGTPTPNTSSMLDVTSTTKGFLMPRMTTTERTAIASPAAGLQVFDTITNSIWFYNGTAWIDSKVSTNIYNSNGSITDAVRTVQLNTNMIQFYTNTAGALVQINDGANGGTALKINAEAGKYGFNQNGNGKFAIDNNGSLGGRFMVLENGNVGLNWNNPSTKLEVRGGGAGFPATTGTTQSAGQYARFHDNGNLTLDMGGNGASGNWLQSTDINNLTANYPLLLNPNGGNVGIGTTTPNAKLDIAGQQVQLTNSGGAAFFKASNGTTDIRLQNNNGNGFVGALTAGADFQIYAGNAVAITALAGGNVGIGITTPSAKLDVSDKFKFYPAGTGSTTDAVLLFGNSANWTRIGTVAGSAMQFWGDGNAAVNNLPNLTINTNGNVGIGTTSPSTLLHVNGIITATKIQGPSDSRFKKNIKPIENALEKITKLGGYTYDWRDASEFPKQTLGKGHDLGVIAQEVEKQFPEAVSTNADGYKAVTYTALVPVLIEAVKTQQIQIEKQQTQINELKKEIAGLKK